MASFTDRIIHIGLCLLAFSAAIQFTNFADADSTHRRTGVFAFSRGDLVIDALIPFHVSSANSTCTDIYASGLVLLEAMKFAVNEVHRLKVLPGPMRLGYEVRDTCSSVLISQKHILELVLKASKYTGYDKSTGRKKLLAVIGAGNSEISVAVNRVLSAFDVPQIGFASTSQYLSDKSRFPTFFRTVPPDSIQVDALVSLFRKFSWNYAAVLFSENDYGRPLANSFKDLAHKHNICVAFEGAVTYGKKLSNNIDKIIKRLKLQVRVDIVVVFVLDRTLKYVLQAMLDNDFVNKTLIASESWSRSTDVYDMRFEKIVRGTLGFAHQHTAMKRFDEYLGGLKPGMMDRAGDPWFNKTWEYLFRCKLTSERILDEPVCDLQEQRLSKNLFSEHHYVIHVINAVFAIAHGIRKYCENSTTPGTCRSSINSQDLLQQLTKLTFRGYNGKDVIFNEYGDVEGGYHLVNIKSDMKVKVVGSWKSGDGGILNINDSHITWNTFHHRSPKGICTERCRPGWYKVSWQKNPRCCWDCHVCAEHMVSNQSNAIACDICGDDQEANTDRTACMKILVSYLHWTSVLTLIGVVIALVAILLLLFVVILYIRFSNTPVVKSSNRELSLLLCLGLFVTFLVPFTFAGKPTPIKCTTSHFMFCIGSALALSAMLFKTLRIVLVFEYNRRKWFLENRYEIAFTIALSLTELIYCLLWVAITPPNVEALLVRGKPRFLVCRFEKYWYTGSYVGLILLSFICTGLAVRGRKLPRNFNEMKHITLSMFTFNIVWLVFSGAQYGTSMGHDSRINCLAIIISSLMILVSLFAPKVFLLLFRPQLNKPEEFHEEIRRYSFQKSHLFDTGHIRSSKTSSFAYSVKDLSTIDTMHSLNAQSSNLLTVPGFVDLNRKRAHTFDSPAGNYEFSNHLKSKKYQSSEDLFTVRRSSMTTPTKTGEFDDMKKEGDLNVDNIHKAPRRCRLCNQVLRRNYFPSPIIVPLTNDRVGTSDVHLSQIKYSTDNIAGDVPHAKLSDPVIQVDVTGQNTTGEKIPQLQSSALEFRDRRRENQMNGVREERTSQSCLQDGSERETVL